MTTTKPINLETLRFRTPRQVDGKELWAIVRDCDTLEDNSCYAYLLMATHFRDTCILAEADDRPVGFVAAYRPPVRPESVFVWQVGVVASMRGAGLGKRVLLELLKLPACSDVRYLEATATPSNIASQRLFTSIAVSFGVPVERLDGFAEADFPAGAHEAEQLLRIGPLEVT